jgi:RimJ/RimL family protein N-acetyltransferase
MAMEAVDESGRIVGMVGFDGWLPGACCLHVAVDSPIALRRLVRAAFGVAFDAKPAGFDKAAVIATIRSDNARSLRLVKHLGFRHAYTGRDWFGRGLDFEVFELRRSECRYWQRARKVA